MSRSLVGNQDKRSFEENLEQYQVYSAWEIGRILKSIQSTRQLIRMNFAGTMETVIVSVLNVDIKERTLLLDSPPQAQREIALRSNLINFEGVVDKIRIAFAVNKLYPDTFEGAPALRAFFPERLMRLQRREFFRVPVSGSIVSIPVETAEGNIMYAVCQLRDISGQGLCMLDASLMVDTTIGRIYRNCRLELRDTNPLLVMLQIRNANYVGSGGSQHIRIGCKFINLSASESALIQRYITYMERQQKGMD
jgi:c-di-GMP-binding flagellar brake protein YcgR